MDLIEISIIAIWILYLITGYLVSERLGEIAKTNGVSWNWLYTLLTMVVWLPIEINERISGGE